MEKDKSKCYYCERGFNSHTRKRTKDHVLPKILGGTNAQTNIVYCCTDCNKNKAGLLLWEWEWRLNNERWLKSMMYTEWIERTFTIIKNIRNHPQYEARTGTTIALVPEI